MKKFMKRINKKGFTLVELIIVIVVIGILAGMATPKFIGVARDAKVAGLQNDIDTLRSVAAVLETKRGLDGTNYDTPYATKDDEVVLPEKFKDDFMAQVEKDLTTDETKPVTVESLKLKYLDDNIYKGHLSGKLKSGSIEDFAIATEGEYAGEIFYVGDTAFVDANNNQHFGLNVVLTAEEKDVE